MNLPNPAPPPAQRGSPPAWLRWLRLAGLAVACAVIAIAIVLLRREPAQHLQTISASADSAASPTLAITANGQGTPSVSPGAVVALTQPRAAPGGALGALDHAAPKEGQPAPDFALTDVQGRRIQLSALRGKVVVVNFWATWCGPCQQEFPELQQAAASLNSADLVVLAVDEAESAKTVIAFRDRHGADFDILLDSNNAVDDAYHFTGIPDSLIVGRDGTVLHIAYGPLSAGTFAYWMRRGLNAP